MRSPGSVPREAADNPVVPTEDTFSLAVDVGMFYGQALIANLARAKWSLKLSTKKNDLDYGQAVISGFIVPPNPIRIALGAVYALARRQPTRLRSSFEHWLGKGAASHGRY